MHGSFLKDIALVLGVAALTSSISFKFRLPSVLGYLVAGFIIGPYIPIPIFADPHRVESLSEFGVILVMFSIGMEFSLRKFFRVLPTSGVTAALEVGAMFMVGVSLGYFFGWSIAQSIFMGGALAISSTMIVSKVFEENRPTEKTREHVLGVLVIQDVVAIVLLTLLGAFAASNQLSVSNLVPTVSKLIFILVSMTVAGLFIVPRFIKYISALKNAEALIIVATGLCFVLALIVQSLGYSVALGAFLAGVLVAESGEGRKIEHLSKPLKDVFVAIFFVSVGMTVDPLVAVKVLPQALLTSLVVIVCQFLVVFAGSVLSGTGLNRALFSALSLGQIGEFSFIIAAIGTGAGMVSKEFQAIIVSVAILTSLATPMLWRNSEKIVNYISSNLPNQFRIAVGLYEAWFNRILENENNLQNSTLLGIPKKVIFGLFLDSLLLVSIPPLFLKFLPDILTKLGIPQNTIFASVTLFIILGLFLAPVVYGFVKMASALVVKLSQSVFPTSIKNSKYGSSAERLFNLTVWSILCLIVSFPVLASISFFIDSFVFIILVLVLLSTIVFQIWRSAGKVAYEYETGGEKLLSVIRRQTRSKTSDASNIEPPHIPGLENLESVKVKNQKLVGKTLSELNLRNQTGATVVSIARDKNLIMFPNHAEQVCLNDVFHIWGSDEAKTKCKDLLGQ